MDIYKILHILVLYCVINEGLACQRSSRSSDSFGGSRRSGSDSFGTSRYRPESSRHDSETCIHQTDMEKTIERFEGYKPYVYDAQPNNPKKFDATIGMGFNMKRSDARETLSKALPGVDYDKLKSGEQGITREQARVLLRYDLKNKYIPSSERRIGKKTYDKLPEKVKTAVVNSVYRGDLGPKTAKLMREEKWDQAGKEYLNHKEYRDSVKNKQAGVKTRMDWNKKNFDSMIDKKG